ncbi:pickpocket protein 19-like [Athalia rosae]|uniref:pickpocket protein 19-like n=1 Tax=Athalia rosae TaxID=37344 RepID=UPI0020346302|nr:pickpocket protein 19-like [Athalia rosae]
MKYLLNTLVRYCKRSSLHGLNYIVEPGAHLMDRLIWSVLFITSVVSAGAVIYLLSTRFKSASTSTVVETTNYPIWNLPFPSVTFCPSSRIDWQKAMEIEKEMVPKGDREAIKTYREVVTKLASLTFGDFDEFRFLRNRSMGMQNMTTFLRSVAPTCSKLLKNCWWRDDYEKCCDLFEEQRTEYGFCFSFNSETADHDMEKYSEVARPRRASWMGEWHGIRFYVKLNETNQPPRSGNALGITVFIGHPTSWASSGQNVGIGTMASISVQCPSSYATKRVLTLQENKMPCVPNPNNEYNQEYCMTRCRRDYVISRCGCNPYFLMPAANKRDCDWGDLICLDKENDFFNHYIVSDNKYFPRSAAGMNCSCLPECEVYDYMYQISHTALGKAIASDTVLVDVHFASSTMIRYRTDMVHTPLDLLVSFGGVIGLFLGGSILSAVEIFYYLTVGIIRQAFRRSEKFSRKRTGDKKKLKNFDRAEQPSVQTVHGVVLPLVDFDQNQRSMNFYKY